MVGLVYILILSLTAISRNDLNISNSDFETVWVEIDNKKVKICYFVVFTASRHPNTDIENLATHSHFATHKSYLFIFLLMILTYILNLKILVNWKK